MFRKGKLLFIFLLASILAQSQGFGIYRGSLQNAYLPMTLLKSNGQFETYHLAATNLILDSIRVSHDSVYYYQAGIRYYAGSVSTVTGSVGSAGYGLSLSSSIFRVDTTLISTKWFASSQAGSVTSVFGRTGVVVAASGDYSAYYPVLTGTYSNPSWIQTLAASKVGLGNADNTSDANKPVSTAQAAAIAGKLSPSDTVNKALRLWAGTNTGITGTFPTLTITATGSGGSTTLTNNLTTSSTGTALDAAQGKVLKDTTVVLRNDINSIGVYVAGMSGVGTSVSPFIADSMLVVGGSGNFVPFWFTPADTAINLTYSGTTFKFKINGSGTSGGGSSGQTLLVTDNFNRSGNIIGSTTSDGLATWTDSNDGGATISTNGSALYQSSGGAGTSRNVYINAGARNCDVRVTLGSGVPTGGAVVSILMAYTNGQNGIYVDVLSGGIGQNVGGSQTISQAGTGTSVAGDIIRAVLNGSTLSIYRTHGGVETLINNTNLVYSGLTATNVGFQFFQDNTTMVDTIDIYSL